MQQEDTTSNAPLLAYLEARERAFAVYEGRTVYAAHSMVASDGVPLTVFEAGDPEQPTVLLVNALGVSCLFLTEIARCLAQSHHVLSWESRGLPDEPSWRSDADLSIARHSMDAAEILAHKSCRPDAVVSYCSGANIAVYALAKQIIGTKRLCLISPSIELAAVSERTDYQRTMPQMWRQVARSGLRHAALVRALMQEGRKTEHGAIEDELYALNNLPFRSDESTYRYAQLQAACLEPDWGKLLGQAGTPALVLHGEQDDLIHIETSKAVARMIPGALFRNIRHHGHFAVYTSAELHQQVTAFLHGIERTEH
jgi:pimeloyl-ACP methyl ester carboxylesterase